MPFRPGAKRSCGWSTPPGTALSVTEYAPDKDSLEIYLLCEADGMRRIHVYDALKKTQRTLPGEFGCSEIVMAK